MKYVFSFVGGMVVMIIAAMVTFAMNKVAFVNHVKYSGDASAYIYSGQIDADCTMTTYTTRSTVHHSITAYSVWNEDQVAGGASITTRGYYPPVVALWDAGGKSMNNQYSHQIFAVMKKGVRKDNTAVTACLAEAKVDKSKW